MPKFILNISVLLASDIGSDSCNKYISATGPPIPELRAPRLPELDLRLKVQASDKVLYSYIFLMAVPHT